MSSDRPSIPTELLAGARVVSCAEQTAERPWQNEGQATVTTVRVQLSDTRTLALIRKRGSVPKKVDGSRRTAENKLFSFSAESQFLRLLGHKLQPTVPVAWSLLHDAVDRSFDLLMSDLSAQGFSRRPEALDFEDAKAALSWLAELHAMQLDRTLPSGLWEQGTYWNMSKGHAAALDRMESHWRLARRSLVGLRGTRIDSGLPVRLQAAAETIDRALYSVHEAAVVAVGGACDGAPDAAKRRRVARHERMALRTLHHTVVHGDYKAENLFFRPRADGGGDGGGDSGDGVDDKVGGGGACGVCDFQWSGRAVGACDVIYLLTTSLADGLLRACEGALLRFYYEALCAALARHGRGGGASFPLEDFEHEYALATLDFARFVLADAPLVDGDEWLCARADALLTRLERAAGRRTPAAYETALAASSSPFAGSLPAPQGESVLSSGSE